MWKPLLNKCVLNLKPLRKSPKGKKKLKRTLYASGELGLERLQIILELDTGWCASEDIGPPRGWIVRSHVGWRGERNIVYKSVEISLQHTRFKILRGGTKGIKRKISASGGLGLLQKTRHQVVYQQGCWASNEVDCEIPYRLKRGTKHYFYAWAMGTWLSLQSILPSIHICLSSQFDQVLWPPEVETEQPPSCWGHI